MQCLVFPHSISIGSALSTEEINQQRHDVDLIPSTRNSVVARASMVCVMKCDTVTQQNQIGNEIIFTVVIRLEQFVAEPVANDINHPVAKECINNGNKEAIDRDPNIDERCNIENKIGRASCRER